MLTRVMCAGGAPTPTPSEVYKLVINLSIKLVCGSRRARPALRWGDSQPPLGQGGGAGY